jgi:diguanylate cyclase (GGDEF)-like protein
MFAEPRPAQRLGGAFLTETDRSQETGEDHRDRLFVQVLLTLAVNILALILIFYLLLPLSEEGRELGGVLLHGVFALIVTIRLIFWKFGNRDFCANLLLITLTCLLLGASFVLGGVLSPTMIFMCAIPVLAATMMQPRWAYFWTAVTVAAWLLMVVLETNGAEITRITRAQNVGIVQVISLMGTLLVVMGVLASYVSSNIKLRGAMLVNTERLDYLASHDPLTSIPNRRAFFEEAQQCLLRSARQDKPFALLVIDLNEFKNINDELGHSVGDAVLVDFSQRLRDGFRETDVVGRLGGDEFGVLLQTVDDPQGVELAIQRFFEQHVKPLEADGKPVDYHCAIGSALYPEQGENLLLLYETADAAMYEAKRESAA